MEASCRTFCWRSYLLSSFSWCKNVAWSSDNSINGKKGKTHQKSDKISGWKYTRTQSQTHENMRYFGNYRCLSWSEERKCMWTHSIYSLLIEKGIYDHRNISSFHVFVYFHSEISSLFWWVFPFFPFIELYFKLVPFFFLFTILYLCLW